MSKNANENATARRIPTKHHRQLSEISIISKERAREISTRRKVSTEMKEAINNDSKLSNYKNKNSICESTESLQKLNQANQSDSTD